MTQQSEIRTARKQRSTAVSTSVDPEEVRQFDALAAEWWNPNGPMRPLHALNPTRLEFIRREALAHFGQGASKAKALAGLRVLDIGCGAGLLSEPLTRMGAEVTGIDPGEEVIAAAKAHAERMGLTVEYRATTVEVLAAESTRFDLVIASEVIEHVPDPAGFIRQATECLAPGGLFLGSTLNRTRRAYAFAILGAEMLLKLLPRGTHSWDKFVTPDEFAGYLTDSGLVETQTTGMIYNPLAGRWRLGEDTAVNYWIAAKKSG